jgi:ketosteroid isomerase-like protein
MRSRCFTTLLVVVLGLTSAAAAESDVAVILSLRADSNAGLLAHDVDQVLRHTTDDFVLVGGVSGAHVGKAVVHDYFLKGFAEPGFVTYIRAPDKVTISQSGERASEVAQADAMPTWKPGDEFEAARKRALSEAGP